MTTIVLGRLTKDELDFGVTRALADSGFPDLSSNFFDELRMARTQFDFEHCCFTGPIFVRAVLEYRGPRG